MAQESSMTHTKESPLPEGEGQGEGSGPSGAPLVSSEPAVLREPQRYAFEQAMRLLQGLTDGPVRVRPDTATVFPPGDVRAARLHHDGADLTVTFGGLYGVDAALPEVFVDRVPVDLPGTEPLRDFLDLFSARLYDALYGAWARYRPDTAPHAERAAGDDPHTQRALALAGLATPGETDEGRALDPAELLPFAGRLAGWHRTADGLSAILTHTLELPVQVVENVPRHVRIPDRPVLGGGRLGIDMTVGERVLDGSGAFRLVVGPLELDRFLGLLPGEPEAARLAKLVALAAPDGLAYDVELRLDAPEVPPLVLGQRESAQLGRTATLGTPKTAAVARTVRYAV